MDALLREFQDPGLDGVPPVGHEPDHGFQFPGARPELGDLFEQGFGGPVHVHGVTVRLLEPAVHHHTQALDVPSLLVDLLAGDRNAFHGRGGARELGRVLLEVPDHPGEVIRGPAEGGGGPPEVLGDLFDSQGGLLHFPEHGAEVLGDLVGGFAHVVRELPDFFRHHGETLARFARMGGFDGGIEGQKLRLPRHVFDELDHVADALGPLGSRATSSENRPAVGWSWPFPGPLRSVRGGYSGPTPGSPGSFC